MLKNILFSILLLLVTYSRLYSQDHFIPRPLDPDQKVKGWRVSIDDMEKGLNIIDNAREYDINHLQLLSNLIQVRDPQTLQLANALIEHAHKMKIQEVVVWDHTFYDLGYYPEKFKTGPGGTINMDDPDFWEWFKADYREMLDLIPGIQGIVLTYIETGAKAENQHSVKLKTDQEKLAAVTNAVASVVIKERGMNLYARTFSHSHKEYENITGAIKFFEYPEIRLMMKETPHDFFLTHPNNPLPGTIPRPTIIEFDNNNEFHGRGNVANTWPEYILKRWGDFLRRDHIIGYTARIGNSFRPTLGTPTEINLYALKRLFEDNSLTADDIYNEFITNRYGVQALSFVKSAFQNAFDIVTSIFYTLGTNTTQHSKLNWEFRHHWVLHVSGRWMEHPVVFVEHGVNREFHYWKDVVNTLAPAWAKKGADPKEINPFIHVHIGTPILGIKLGQTPLDAVPWVKENRWLSDGELMNEEYLSYIITEKEYGVRLAKESLALIEDAKPYLDNSRYLELFHYFNRTLLYARLHKAVASAYFGYRVYSRGEEFRHSALMELIRNALQEIPEVSSEIQNYHVDPSIVYRDTARRYWIKFGDVCLAMNYYYWINSALSTNTFYAF